MHEVKEPLFKQLRKRLEVWKSIGASKHILNLIQFGAKPSFISQPKEFNKGELLVSGEELKAWI